MLLVNPVYHRPKHNILYGVKYKTVRGEWRTLHESLKQETYWYRLTVSWFRYLTSL